MFRFQRNVSNENLNWFLYRWKGFVDNHIIDGTQQKEVHDLNCMKSEFVEEIPLHTLVTF